MAYLQEAHKKAAIQIEEMYNRWQVSAADRDVLEPAFIPRPIFFNMLTKRHETETWFEERQQAASVAGSISNGVAANRAKEQA